MGKRFELGRLVKQSPTLFHQEIEFYQLTDVPAKLTCDRTPESMLYCTERPTAHGGLRLVYIPLMHTSPPAFELSTSKQELYRELQSQFTAVLAGERDFLANMANSAAMLFHSLPQLNWAGFYLFRQDQLVLGPFQGKPACVRIAIGRGVCGTAALRRETIVVRDVHLFPGHIACDDASRSEIVIPMIFQDRLVGVMDLDSPVEGRFEDEDATELEAIVAILLAGSDVINGDAA